MDSLGISGPEYMRTRGAARAGAAPRALNPAASPTLIVGATQKVGHWGRIKILIFKGKMQKGRARVMSGKEGGLERGYGGTLSGSTRHPQSLTTMAHVDISGKWVCCGLLCLIVEC